MSQYVDYDCPELRLAPRKNRPTRRETMYRVICSHCGNERFLTAQAAAHAAKKDACRRCANKKAAAKGFATLIQKYGEDFATTLLREKRLNCPSNLERRVMSLLDQERIAYSREYPIKTDDGILFYDFAFDNVLIEVDGTYWHSRPERAARDAYKSAIANEQGFILVRIKEERLKDAQSLLYAALQDPRYRPF